MTQLILASLTIDPHQVGALTEYCDRVRMLFLGLQGFESVSLWARQGEPTKFVLAYEYGNDAVAKEGLRMLSESGLVLAALNVLKESPQVHIVLQDGRSGTPIGKLPIHALATLRHKIVGPGMAEVELAEIHDVFIGFGMLPGCLGHVRGSELNLDDSVYSIGFWENIEALKAATPDHETRMHTFVRVY